MAYFEFPHTRNYDSDLGWLIVHVKDLLDCCENMTAWKAAHEQEYNILAEKVEGLINNLVDVIVPWDSSIAYHIFSIVEYQGTNYIAVKDVPVGAMITDTTYWQPANTVVQQINAMAVIVGELNDKIYYTTPQEFGAVGDGVTDDTGAIAAAIATGKAVYIPEGIYKVSAPFEINNGQQIYGVGINSILRADASFSGNYIFLSDYDVGHFDFENLQIDCNDVQNLGGIYAKRPYNMCTIRNVLVNNCAYYAYYIGIDVNDVSQTFLMDDCMALGSETVLATVPLAYFNRVLEANIMNSKFMFRSVNRPGVPCVVFNRCWDLFVRGCSFANTSCHGLELYNNCRYFTLLRNTYEHTGVDTGADSSAPTGYSLKLHGLSGESVTSGLIMEYPYHSGSAAHAIEAEYTNIVTILGTWSVTEDSHCYANSIINTRDGSNTTASLKIGFDGPYLNLGRFTRLKVDDQNYGELRMAAGQFEIRNTEAGVTNAAFRLANNHIYNLQNDGALVLKDTNGGNHFIRVDTGGNLVVTNS